MSSQLPVNSLPRPRIGRQLRQLLDDRFITQDELAIALGVHSQNVSRWARNETTPQKRRLRQIAEFFDVEPQSLIDVPVDEEEAA